MRKFIIFSLLVIVLLVSGCAEEQPIDRTTTPFAGGQNALSMEFVRGAPPEEVFDDGGFPFSISVLIENLGEHDVPEGDGYLEVTGINPRDFDKASQDDLIQDIPVEIDGVVKNFEGTILVGDKIDMSFDDLNYIPDATGNFLATVRANLCYNYETLATTLLCIKRELLTNIGQKEICDLSGDKSGYNSGAPIQISGVEQNPAGKNKLQAIFTLSHVGDTEDRFFKEDTDCDDVPSNTDKDLVWFEVVTEVEGKKADCSGLRDALSDNSGGYVELPNGADTKVVCSFDVSDAESIYETPVNIKLRYRYYQYIENKLLIKDVSAGQEE